MKLILMGSPGAGKGTLAASLVPKYQLKHFSTGAILREEIGRGTQLGNLVKPLIEAGNLVSDELTVQIVEHNLSLVPGELGVLFDGFPRTLSQAEWLDAYLVSKNDKLDGVVLINVDHDIIIKRLTGRRACPSCGKGYNIYFSPPQKADVCSCGTTLCRREDDDIDTVSTRLKLYSEQADVLAGYYENQGILCRVNGNGTGESVLEQVVDWLDGRE